MNYKISIAILSIPFFAGAHVHAHDQPTEYTTKEPAIKTARLEKIATPQNKEIFELVSINLAAIKEPLGHSHSVNLVEYSENYIAHQVITARSDRTETVKSMKVTDNSILAVELRHTYKELEAMREKIYDLFQSLALSGQSSVVNSIALDEQNNVLRARGAEENLEYIRVQLEKNGFDTSAIIIEKGGRAKLFGQLYGGTKTGASR